jgi:hypothetical protein
MLTSPELSRVPVKRGRRSRNHDSAAIRRLDAFGNGALDQGRAQGEYFDRLAPTRRTLGMIERLGPEHSGVSPRR